MFTFFVNLFQDKTVAELQSGKRRKSRNCSKKSKWEKWGNGENLIY